MILFSASQDGLLSAWSTLTGIHLAAFHFNHTLVKLLVSQSGGIEDNNLNKFNHFFTFFSSTLCSNSRKHTLCCYAESF